MTRKKKTVKAIAEPMYSKEKVDTMFAQLKANQGIDTANIRGYMASMFSGGYDWADTLHNVYADYGYPADLKFKNFWNMYRRFGIAKNVVELPVDTCWSSAPTVKSGNARFDKELEIIINKLQLWQRMKALDTRQRVGLYGGMFMQVRDNQRPSEPLEGKQNGVGALVKMIPMYESQLYVLETDDDETSENFGLPIMYEFRGGVEGNRNPKEQTTFNIHPSRVVIASENADNGGIYGFSSLEAPYNSLMDLRKICGAGGEGFYRNAAQRLMLELKDGASALQNKEKLNNLNEEMDDFIRNPMRRAMWTPGMETKTLSSNLANPKDYFMNSLYDVAASSKIAATILIGQQTGRLASEEDSTQFEANQQSRRENYLTENISNVLDWFIKYGILPASDYEIEWDDLLAASDEEKLANAERMAAVNEKNFRANMGGVFTGDEIREAGGYEKEVIGDLSEGLPEDLTEEET